MLTHKYMKTKTFLFFYSMLDLYTLILKDKGQVIQTELFHEKTVNQEF